MNRVKAFPVVINGQTGYDIMVTDTAATVQDYLDAVNGLIESGPLWRSRNESITECQGCNRCCQERIPLTRADLNVWEAALHWGLVPPDLSLEPTLGNLLSKWCTVQVVGPVVDIMIRRDKSGKCLFLDRNSSKCRLYPHRPLVCQTFICCPAARRAEKLREVVVNCGEDELVRDWLDWARQRDEPLIIHEGDQPAVNPADWPPTVFAGRPTYRDVRLIDVCPASLWRQLAQI